MADESPTDRFRLTDEEKARRLAQVRAKLAGQSETRSTASRFTTKTLITVAAIAVGLIWIVASYLS